MVVTSWATLSAKCERRWPCVERVVRFLGTATLGSFRYPCFILNAVTGVRLSILASGILDTWTVWTVQDLDRKAEYYFLFDDGSQVDLEIDYRHLIVARIGGKHLFESDRDGPVKSAQATIADELNLCLNPPLCQQARLKPGNGNFPLDIFGKPNCFKFWVFTRNFVSPTVPD